MRLAAAFALHELRTQARALRFRVLAALYVAAGSAPAVIAALRLGQAETAIGGASFAAETLDVLPVLTAALAFLIALDAITREQDEGAWSTVSLTGMSSAGYLLRRWLALQAVLLPLTALPVAVAAAVATGALGPGSVTPGPFVGPWLMVVAPIALTFSAFALGAGTVAGGALGAFLLAAFVLLLVPELMNALLGRFSIRLASDWLSMYRLFRSFRRLASLGNESSPWGSSFPLAVSESPYDTGALAEQYLSSAALPAALAAVLLGLAVRYLRRTRPDVRPWRIPPAHPLRTFLATLSRLRERYTPDPAPARADLLALGLALLAACGASVWIIGRAHRYDVLGRVRFAAEGSGRPAPTPGDVLPGRWRVAGSLGPGRRVDLTVTAEMRNSGGEPRAHLAFELNPDLVVTQARAGEGRLALSRSWDRLAVELTPPIPPGGRREIAFRLAGEPAETRFSLASVSYLGFYKSFGTHVHARFFRELADLSGSYRVPAVSDRRIDLVAADLTPVPRYHAWQLDDELRVQRESHTPQAEIDLALAVPPGLFLADTCGGVARGGRLVSRCRMPLADLTVAGGRYRVLPVSAVGTTAAVYPAHAALGELQLGFLAQSSQRIEDAWPGLGDLRQMVVIEWPGEAGADTDPIGTAWFNRWSDIFQPPLEVRGNLLLLNETSLVQNRALKPDGFAAEVVASRLSRRRPTVADDAALFRQLFRALALQRLGLGPENGAVVAGLRPATSGAVRIPPPTEGYNSSLYWRSRFPALVSGLRRRMGDEALRQTVEDLLSQGDGRPCSREELFAALERRGGEDLHRFIQENLVAGGLAEPVLDGVEFRQEAGGWRVTGKLANPGDAEALCKVALATDLGPVETLVRAPAGGAGSFELRTARRPQTVLLDPDRECHRLVPNGAPRDRVFFQGSQRGKK